MGRFDGMYEVRTDWTVAGLMGCMRKASGGLGRFDGMYEVASWGSRQV